MLTKTVKAIYNEFKLAILPSLSPEEQRSTVISADDLVPIFLFIFCQQNKTQQNHHHGHHANGSSSTPNNATNNTNNSANNTNNNSNNTTNTPSSSSFSTAAAAAAVVSSVSSSSLKHCLRDKEFMWKLGHPDQLRGETGYYLTVFESAIECVLLEEEKERGGGEMENSSSGRLSMSQPKMSLSSMSGSFSQRFSGSDQEDRERGNRRSFSAVARSFFQRLSLISATPTVSATAGGGGGGGGERETELETDGRRSRTQSVENPLVRALRFSSQGNVTDDMIRESFA